MWRVRHRLTKRSSTATLHVQRRRRRNEYPETKRVEPLPLLNPPDEGRRVTARGDTKGVGKARSLYAQ